MKRALLFACLAVVASGCANRKDICAEYYAGEQLNSDLRETWKKLKIKAMLPREEDRPALDLGSARRRLNRFCEFYKY